MCIIVGHADAEADAERVARELRPIADTLLIQPLGPVVGAHAGPGVVGVGCYSADLFPLGINTASDATASLYALQPWAATQNALTAHSIYAE